jgi:GNAT superfamily N-acetyltransferase
VPQSYRHNGAVRIRAAREAELPLLRDIERAAGAAFRDIGMGAVADDEPPPLEVLDGYRRAGRCWVAAGPDGTPAAYLVADIVDGNLHIEQVSVHPRHARRGIGRALLEHAAAYASAGGLPAMTLTTFTEVPWNAPYYLRCGFRTLEEDEMTPGLRAIRVLEAAHGLDRWPRTCMRRDLPPRR